MVAVDEDKKELVVGIIDVVRTYTWVRLQPLFFPEQLKLTSRRTKSSSLGSKIEGSREVVATGLPSRRPRYVPTSGDGEDEHY